MATSMVSIGIQVVDQNSAAVLQKTEQAVARVGAAGTTASSQMVGFNAGLNQTGAAGTKTSAVIAELAATMKLSQQASVEMTAAAIQLSAALRQGGNAAEEAGTKISTHARRATGAMREVTGAARELGIGVSRYFAGHLMEMFPGLIGALKAFSTLFFALGSAEILVHMAHGLGEVYDEWLNLNKAEKDYIENLGKAAEKQFLNFESVGAARSALHSLNEELREIKERQDRIGTGLSGVDLSEGASGAGASLVPLKQTTDQEYANKAKQDEARLKALDKEHEFRTRQIADEQRVAEVGAGAWNKIGISEQFAVAQAKENLSKTQQQTAEYNRMVEIWNKAHAIQIASGAKSALMPRDLSSGIDEYVQAVVTATQLGQKQRAELARQETNELATASYQAVQAGLQGEALYASKRQEAIDAVVRKFQEGERSKQWILQQTSDIATRFDNERKLRMEQTAEALRHSMAESESAGLAIIPKMRSEQEERERQLQFAAAKEGPQYQVRFLPGQIAASRLNFQQQTTASNKEFYERLAQMNDEWNSSQLQGYARIEAETQRHVESLRKDFEKRYGPDYQNAAGFADSAANINANADRERAQLHRQTMMELQKEESDAARALMPPWQAAQQQILEQYRERTDKARQELDQTLAYAKLSAAGRIAAESDYQAKVQAARQLEQAQMQRATEQMRDQLATGLSQFIHDPFGTLEKRAEETMMKIVANWVMQLGDFQHNEMLQWLFGMGKNLPVWGSASSSGIPGLSSTAQTSTVGTQLVSAGSTLDSAGGALITAAADLSAAASTLGGGGFGGLGIGGGSSAVPGMSASSALPSDLSETAMASELNALIPAGAGTAQASKLAQMFPNSLSFGGTTISGTQMAMSGAMTAFTMLPAAYRSGSELLGAAGGAASGAQLGFAAGGPLGALGGGVLGGITGFFTGMFGADERRRQARNYLYNTVEPEIQSALLRYYSGEGDYNEVRRALEQIRTQEGNAFSRWGKQGSEVWRFMGIPELQHEQKMLFSAEAAGRGDLPKGAAQFDSGGPIVGFGRWSLGGGAGMVKAELGEYVVRPGPTAENRPLLDAINSGNASALSRRTPAIGRASAVAPVHLHIHSLDLKDFRSYLRSGGAQAIAKAANSYVGEYAGEADF